MNVNGRPVVPGGHPLVAAASETSRLAFVAPLVACRAGQRATALLQLQDARGNNMQARKRSLPAAKLIIKNTGTANPKP